MLRRPEEPSKPSEDKQQCRFHIVSLYVLYVVRHRGMPRLAGFLFCTRSSSEFRQIRAGAIGCLHR